MPATAKQGSIIEIRAIAQHDMESGFRYTEGGKLIPRDIIREFTCTYNNVEVFRADFYPSILPSWIICLANQNSGRNILSIKDLRPLVIS